MSSCELRLSIYNCNHAGSLLIKLTKSWISCDHLRNWSLNTTNVRVIIPPCVLQYDQTNIISFFFNIISACIILYFTNLQYTQGVIIYSKVILSRNPPLCQHECRESQTFLPGNTPIEKQTPLKAICVCIYRPVHVIASFETEGDWVKLDDPCILRLRPVKIFKIPCLGLARLTMDQLHMLNTIFIWCAC